MTKDKKREMKHNVVIVGSGFSGIVAANRLVDSGLDVLSKQSIPGSMPSFAMATNALLAGAISPDYVAA